jgi:Tol biopolymer transport system component
MDAAFTEDGGTLYVTKIAGRTSYTIVVSQRNAKSWSPPVKVPFSGRWRDLEEALSPDGGTMIFASNRPADSGGKPLDAYYNERYSHARGGNLWIVKRTRTGWGTPARLPDAVNANTSTFSPAIDNNKTLYFMRASGPGGHFHIFTARLEHGVYASSSLAPFSDMRYADFDPTIAPDGSFVIFTSTRPPTPSHQSALFISFRHGAGWTVPRDMGTAIDPAGDAVEARLSPDTNKLYYSSRLAVWTIDLQRWLN